MLQATSVAPNWLSRPSAALHHRGINLLPYKSLSALISRHEASLTFNIWLEIYPKDIEIRLAFPELTVPEPTNQPLLQSFVAAAL